MSDSPSHGGAAAASPSAAHGDHSHPSYVKIWAILLGLLIVSFVGPFLGIRVVTLITAFGIAIVKAYIVARYFMHINLEKKYVVYLVGAMLVLMFLMVGASSGELFADNAAAVAKAAQEAHRIGLPLIVESVLWGSRIDDKKEADRLACPHDWPNNYSFMSRHPGGGQFCLGDGSVRFVPEQIDLAVYRGAGTIMSGEATTLPQ